MPPLKKGDVRQALDKRIEAARRAQTRLSPVGDEGGRAVEKAKEQVLQNVRNELFGERLPKAAKKV